MQLIPQRTLILTCFCTAVAMLTGCANIQPKIDAFEQQSKRLGTIYAQVDTVQTPDEWGYCNSNSNRIATQTKKAVCQQSSMNAVKVSWVSTQYITYSVVEAIPSSFKLMPGAIVVLDMNQSYGRRFVSIASLTETELCRWSGKDNAALDSSFKKAAVSIPAFVAGALMPIPSAAYLVSTRNDLGGVVCNGWNYQEAYKDKDINSLLDIF